MPFNLSTGELLVLLVVAILVFGGRLPEVARKVARGVGAFRRGMNEEMRRIDAHTRIDEEPPPRDWNQPPDGADCDGFGRVKGDEAAVGQPPEEAEEAERADAPPELKAPAEEAP